MRRLFLLASLAMASTAGGAVAEEDASPAHPRFIWPLACTLGQSCWIQHYVDRDPAGPPRDYTCGSLTYHAHNGTDIRVADMAAQRAGVAVLAAAEGRVLRSRDGQPDVSVRIRGLAAVEREACGNGLVIDHGGGWETQYCHMAKGSLIVKPGDRVTAGQPLGHVGLSGETEFPHLHIIFRHDGVVVDPFAPEAGAGGRCGSGQGVWAKTPPYTPRAVVNVGFAPGPVDMAALEAGDIPRPGPDAPYVVAYVRTIGLKAGDQPALTLFDPQGAVLASSPPAALPTNNDQRFVLVGKKRPAAGWRTGAYRARYSVAANGKTVLVRDFAIVVKTGDRAAPGAP